VKKIVTQPNAMGATQATALLPMASFRLCGAILPGTLLQMGMAALERDLVGCRRCPRLVAWRERVGREKRAAFRDWEYWAKPVPGYGDPQARLLIVGLAPAAHGANRTGRMFTGDRSGDWLQARLLIVGLAPAAHGANRTGRMFTGDRSGDWLYRALHLAGFASQSEAVSRDDGLMLTDAYVSAIVRCAPPDNKPVRAEQEECRCWLEAELDLLSRVEVVVTLGSIAYVQVLRVLHGRHVSIPIPRPRFAHGVEIDLRPAGPLVIASYHPSQQNTFTGRLTEQMLEAVFARANEVLGDSGE